MVTRYTMRVQPVSNEAALAEAVPDEDGAWVLHKEILATTGEAFEAWIAKNWPNLATPEWLSSEEAVQQMEAFSAGCRHGAAKWKAIAESLGRTVMMDQTSHDASVATGGRDGSQQNNRSSD